MKLALAVLGMDYNGIVFLEYVCLVLGIMLGIPAGILICMLIDNFKQTVELFRRKP